MAYEDRYGLTLSTASAEAASAYREGTDLLLAAWTGAAEAFEGRDRCVSGRDGRASHQ